MKLYKLKISGDKSKFNIEYSYSTNFLDYVSFDVSGTEQEKYDRFINDVKADNGSQPINIKVKMTTQNIDRALPRKAVTDIADVNDFISRIGK